MSTDLRATATNQVASGGSYPITIPATAQVGDIAVFSLQINNATATITPPSGWTEQSGPDPTSTASECFLFTKQLVAGDPGSTVTFNLDGAGTGRGLFQLDVISGGTLTGAFFGKSIPTSAGTSNTVPALTGVPAGAYVSVHCMVRLGSGAAPTFTGPTGYTDDGDLTSTTNASGANFSAKTVHKVATVTGNLGGETVTFSTSAVGPIYAMVIPAAGAQVVTSYANTAEGGTDGTGVTTANSGGASGDAFSSVVVDGTGTTLTYAAGAAYKGALGYQLAAPTSGHSFVRFATFAAPVKSARLRHYVKLPSYPSVPIQHVQTSSTGAELCYLNLDTAGFLSLVDAAGATLYNFTHAMALNTVYRVEFVITPGTGASDGAFRVALYAGDSATAIETYTNTACNAGTTTIDHVNVGKVSSSGSATLDLDDIALDNKLSTQFIGPSAATRTGKVKYWDGASWGSHPVKRWDGTTWTTHLAKGTLDGTTWITGK